MKVPVNQKHLEELFQEQLQFLRASADAYDRGNKAEAKRVALAVRVLLHDTQSSHSLSGQLGKKSVSFLNTCIPDEPGNLSSHGGLIHMSVGGSIDFFAPLDSPSPYGSSQIQFDEWWTMPVFRSVAGGAAVELTRKDLILIACNQDGGAHVDPEIDQRYLDVKSGVFMGWKGMSPSGERYLTDSASAEIRQVGHEVLKTFEIGYSKLPDMSKTGMVIANVTLLQGDRAEQKYKSLSHSSKRAKGQPIARLPVSPEIRHAPDATKLGRNEPCWCGSGIKFKRCHGAPN